MAAFLASWFPSRPAVNTPALESRRPIVATATPSMPARIVQNGYFNPSDLRQGYLDPVCADFNRFNAYILGVLSDAMYGDLDANRLLRVAQAVDPDFSRVFPVSNSNTQVAVFEHSSCLAVIWRGSNSGDAVGSDWKDNLDYDLTDVLRVQDCPVQFHVGFWRHVERVWNPETSDMHEGIKPILRRLLSERKRKVFFAGHSLGGGAAVVAACRFLLEGGNLDDVAQIVTFGQPRAVHGLAAKQLLSEQLGSRYFRYVNETDFVPNFPISMKFSHGGTLMFGTINKTVITNPGVITILYRKFASFIINFIHLKFSMMGDHDVKLYWNLALDGKYEE